MRLRLGSVVPWTARGLHRHRGDSLSVVVAALVAASLASSDGRCLTRGPPRWSSAWVRAGGRLSGTSASLCASLAMRASLTVQRRGFASSTSTSADTTADTDAAAAAVAAVAALSTRTKLRHRRGSHRRRGRVSVAEETTPLADVSLGDDENGGFAVVVDSVLPAGVLVDSSKKPRKPLRRRAIKSSVAAAADAGNGTLDDAAVGAQPPTVTATAHLNGFSESTGNSATSSQPTDDANGSDPALKAPEADALATEMALPSRKKRSTRVKRGDRGRRAGIEAGVEATETTVEPVAVAAALSVASRAAVSAPLTEAAHVRTLTAASAASHEKPSRRRKGERPGCSETVAVAVAAGAASVGGVGSAGGVEPAGVAVVPSLRVADNHPSSWTADTGEGESRAPGIESAGATAPPQSSQHPKALSEAVASDAKAVERRPGRRGRRRLPRQGSQEAAEKPASSKNTEVVVQENNNKTDSADELPDGLAETSGGGGGGGGGPCRSSQRQRSASRTRGGKRLRAEVPVTLTSAAEESVAVAAQAPAVGDATAEKSTSPPSATKVTPATHVLVGAEEQAAPTAPTGSPRSKMDADVEVVTETLESTTASCASTSKGRRSRRKRATANHVLSPADGATPEVAVATAHSSVPEGAAADGGKKKLATPPPATGSFHKLFANVEVEAADPAKGLSPLALKKRLAAKIIRRRWQLQQRLTLSPQPPPSTSGPPPVDEAGFTANLAAAEPKGDVGAAAAAAASSEVCASSSPSSPRRRLKRGKSLDSRDAAAPPPMAATSSSVGPIAGDKATVAGSAKSKGRATKKGGRRCGLGGRRSVAGTATTATVTSASPVVEPERVDGVEDLTQSAEREADVAAAMAAAMALVSKPEVIDDEYPMAPQAEEEVAAVATADSTPVPHSLVALAAARVSQQQQQLEGAAGGLKAGFGAKGGASSGSGSISSGSGKSGKGGKGANSKDTLFFPDYRERVVQIFEQLTQINSALGERFKSQSYGRFVERIKRGDKVFQLLPPNLLPLPEDDPKNMASMEAFYKDDPAAKRRRAEEVERNRAKRSLVLSPDNLLPGIGTKLREKVIEVLTTGGLKELHEQEAKPLICAIRELTQVHGVGPRTAIDYFKKYNISTVEQLRSYATKAGELDMNNKSSGKPANLVVCADKSKFHLNEAQRLGLVYYEDMCHRIPHEEGRLHEAFMKLRMRKYLGKDYELVVCGSYRRQVETAGDIDVLITHKRSSAEGGGRPLLPPSGVLDAFLAGLKADRYIEATLAQGPTKFMGLCRLRAMGSELVAPGKGKETKANTSTSTTFRARRLDVRYVDSDSFPAAMLYFTGSKNFNVIMRSEAIKKNCILNEYGLFRKPTRRQMQQYSVLQKSPDLSFHDMVTRLARFDITAIKDEGDRVACGPSAADAKDGASTSAEGSAAGKSVTAAAKKVKRKGKEKTKQEIAELHEIAKIVERQRVKAQTERAIFEALGMDYVSPKDRSV
ncbi:hypothetical protein JKF63_07891 [Porcisia hertigi]|uniref:DNA-directed DNA polymerase X domain-containing protein n=1 Tax=Porcisia hertigi TaxID=2761500 RepID=A0A836LJQ7_9TRYP|nr:hypothetical protein JKF63_07891 [Porcisia hertigi]